MLDRDGQQRSATQVRNQALTDADHLAVLAATTLIDLRRATANRAGRRFAFA